MSERKAQPATTPDISPESPDSLSRRQVSALAIVRIINANARCCSGSRSGLSDSTEHRWVLAHPGPARLGRAPGPPPDLRGLPAPARTVNRALLWAMSAEFTATPGGEEPDVIRGVPGAAGVYEGTARIVRSEADFSKVEPGDVVVCPITNPSWSVLFGIAGAFVCDGGGPLSHTAILAREYDLPSVLATGNASRRLSDGAPVTVDGAAATVSAVPESGPAA